MFSQVSVIVFGVGWVGIFPVMATDVTSMGRWVCPVGWRIYGQGVGIQGMWVCPEEDRVWPWDLGYAPPGTATTKTHMVGNRTVRILLECFLVLTYVSSFSSMTKRVIPNCAA